MFFFHPSTNKVQCDILLSDAVLARNFNFFFMYMCDFLSLFFNSQQVQYFLPVKQSPNINWKLWIILCQNLFSFLVHHLCESCKLCKLIKSMAAKMEKCYTVQKEQPPQLQSLQNITEIKVLWDYYTTLFFLPAIL